MKDSADHNFKLGKKDKAFQMGRKTLWEKEKLLITSNFSFSHSVFKRLVLQTRKNQGLFGKGLRKVKAVGKWLVMLEQVGVGGVETGCLRLVPSAKLHLPMLPGISFPEVLQPNDSTFIRFVFEFVIKPSFSITRLSINRVFFFFFF